MTVHLLPRFRDPEPVRRIAPVEFTVEIEQHPIRDASGFEIMTFDGGAICQFDGIENYELTDIWSEHWQGSRKSRHPLDPNCGLSSLVAEQIREWAETNKGQEWLHDRRPE